MKIAWFHSHLLNTNSGGTRFVIDYAIGLKQLFNHDITIFCDCANTETLSYFMNAGITVIQIDRFSTNNFFYWLTLPWRNNWKRKKLQYIELEFDRIVNSMFPMNMIISNFNIPKIQMCYEPFAFFYDEGFLKSFTFQQQLFFRLMKLLYQGYDKAAFTKMDRILTLNKTNLSKIEAVYGRSATPVYAGIDPKIYHRAPTNEINRIRKMHPGKPLLFHSTDLSGIKGTYPLLDIIKHLLPEFPEIKLLVTVYVDIPAGINKLNKYILEMGLESNVEYLGCLQKELLPIYYSSVDFVCQPGLNQPANWPLKEAMLCGTPIIGGVESEEVDTYNGTKINVNEIKKSVIILSKIFAKDRTKFSIDIEGLKQSYSIDNCLGLFNDLVTKV